MTEESQAKNHIQLANKSKRWYVGDFTYLIKKL